MRQNGAKHLTWCFWQFVSMRQNKANTCLVLLTVCIHETTWEGKMGPTPTWCVLRFVSMRQNGANTYLVLLTVCIYEAKWGQHLLGAFDSLYLWGKMGPTPTWCFRQFVSMRQNKANTCLVLLTVCIHETTWEGKIGPTPAPWQIAIISSCFRWNGSISACIWLC
jgi:hypothetical protein